MKPENLLFKNHESDDLVICDFGIAKAANAEDSLDTVCGSPGYVGKKKKEKKEKHI